MPTKLNDLDYSDYEPRWPFAEDQLRDTWRTSLMRLSKSDATRVRRALPDGPDARRIRDIQGACSPITPQLIRDNVSTIAEKSVIIAEIDGVHVGFCLSFTQPGVNGHLIVQVVAVVDEARRRGVGLALLAAAGSAEPNRDIALATQTTNKAARALIDRFADSIDAVVSKVNLGTFQDRDLGIKRGAGYRSLVIERGTRTTV